VGRGIAVSLWSQKIHPANQRFRLVIAVPNLDRGELIPAAAGERIVAFARPGKPSEDRGSPGNRAFSPGNRGRE